MDENLSRVRADVLGNERNAFGTGSKQRQLRFIREQSRMWHEDKKYVTVPAGRRSGKTDISLERIVRKAARSYPWDCARFGYAAPTRAQAKRNAWRSLKSRIPRRFVDSVSESELRITLVNTNEIYVVGLDRPERVEGVSWDGWLLDEYANMHPELLDANILPSLADRDGWLWCIGVPEGRNHYWTLCGDHLAKAGTELEYLYGHYHWKSAAVLPPNVIQIYKSRMHPRLFRQEMEASFEEASGRIYWGFDQGEDVHSFALPEDIGSKKRPWIGGMDFNVNPMCAAFGWHEKVDGIEHVFVWDEVTDPNSNTAKAGKMIIDQAKRWSRFGEFMIVPDATGARRDTRSNTNDHRILREMGFLVRKRSANPLKRDRHNSVNTMFVNGLSMRRVHIHPRCTELIRCLEGIQYKEGTNDHDPVMCKNMDHMTDAFGYWVEKFHRLRYDTKRTDSAGFDPFGKRRAA